MYQQAIRLHCDVRMCNVCGILLETRALMSYDGGVYGTDTFLLSGKVYYQHYRVPLFKSENVTFSNY